LARSELLFDMARYDDAAPLLKRVADGETGDDEGNRKIAQYHLAIALFRLERCHVGFSLYPLSGKISGTRARNAENLPGCATTLARDASSSASSARGVA
jgi:hypothetical protein